MTYLTRSPKSSRVKELPNPSAALTSESKKNNGEISSTKKSKKTVQENQEEEKVIEQPTEKASPVKKGQAKKVYLSTDEIPRRIKELQQRVEELAGPENANKRKRVLQRLTQLKKAAGNPEELLVDPDEELKRVALEKDRRGENPKRRLRSQRDRKGKTEALTRRMHSVSSVSKEVMSPELV